MIKTFKCKETEKVFYQVKSKKLPGNIQDIALRKLFMFDSALSVDDLRIPPGNRLEELKGDRKGQFSIRINQQWRLCFKFENSNAIQVEIVDYH